MSKPRPWHHEGVKCFSKCMSVGLDYIGCKEEKVSQDQLAKRRLDMILAGPHGYPTEKVLNTGNKIGGEVYNSTANKKGCSNLQ